MNGLITLADSPVRPPDPTGQAPLPLVDDDGHPLEWTHRQAAGLRFARWRAERGDFDGDRFGLPPEPLPPIVRRIDT